MEQKNVIDMEKAKKAISVRCKKIVDQETALNAEKDEVKHLMTRTQVVQANHMALKMLENGATTRITFKNNHVMAFVRLDNEFYQDLLQKDMEARGLIQEISDLDKQRKEWEGANFLPTLQDDSGKKK